MEHLVNFPANLDSIKELAEVIDEAKAIHQTDGREFSDKTPFRWKHGWENLIDYNSSLRRHSKTLDNEFDLGIGDYSSQRLEELIEPNRFKEAEADREEVVEKVNNNIKRMYEATEGKEDLNVEKTRDESFELVQEFYNELDLVKIDQHTLLTILNIHNVEKDEQEEFYRKLERHLLEEKDEISC
nr:MAG: hypothetical protein J07AB56_04960 [Candidatus Nanosalinarum sp. J07AB56]